MKLKEKLEFHYKEFDKSRIAPDPLQFLHLFKNKRDIEVMGFIASIFAYGNVVQINNTLTMFIHAAKNKPYDFILNYSKLKKQCNITHRFYSSNDVNDLFLLLSKTYNEYGSLRKLFLRFYNNDLVNLKETISGFSNHFISDYKKSNRINDISLGIKFMFPLPELGSACKRMNLFLRWMVRKDELDFGLWDEIPSNKLIIPLDTHVAKISRKLKLTYRKNICWKMAEEITETLKRFDPMDPVKYDFAICHIGMRKLKF